MSGELRERVLDCLADQPRTISEITDRVDADRAAVAEAVHALDEQDIINTYRISGSTTCIKTDADDFDADPETPEQPVDPDDRDPLDDWFDPDTVPDEDPFADSTAAADDAAAVRETRRQPQPATQSHTGPGDGPRTIGIVSGKGGVGKTVVALNLGAAMQDMGEQVLVVDSDAEMPNVGLQLGMYTFPTSLQQVVEQDVHIMSAMHVDQDSGLRVIPTALAHEERTADVSAAVDMIPDDYVVLVDSPPGLERPVERVIETCDELVFVTTPEIPSVTDTFKLYQEARQRRKDVLGVVVNQYDSPKQHLSVTEVEESLEMPVIGVIPDSGKIQQSVFDNQPVVSMDPYATPSRRFKEIAADLTGNEYEETLMDRVRGLLP